MLVFWYNKRIARNEKDNFIIFLLAILIFGFNYNHILEVEIAKWYEDKEAALSLSFDHGTSDQLYYAIPLLKEMGFKTTFYLIPSKVQDWLFWNELKQEGYEISSHSMTHKNLKQLKQSELHYGGGQQAVLKLNFNKL